MASPSVAASRRQWEVRGCRRKLGDTCVWGGMEKKGSVVSFYFILKRVFLSHEKCSEDLSAGFIYVFKLSLSG